MTCLPFPSLHLERRASFSVLDENQNVIAIDGTRSRRVVFVSDAVCGRNGVGTYYQDLVENLRPHLGHVQLIAPCDHPPQVHQNFSFPIPGDATQRMYWPKRGRLARMLRAARPDVIVFPTIGPYTYFGVQEAKRLSCPIWMVQHTDFERLARLYFHPLVVASSRPIVDWLTGVLLRNADSVSTVNQETAASLQRVGVPEVRVLATPIAKEFLERPTTPLRREIRSILFLGRLAREKNIDTIVRAAEQLPDVRFAIAGDGPLRNHVEQQCRRSGNLRFHGWLPRDAVMDLIDASDLLVLPSSIESFGTVALEAMARGRLVLVSEHCGIRAWPRLAECIYHAHPHESLAAAIQRVAQQPAADRQRLAQLARFAAISANACAIDDWLAMIRQLPVAVATALGTADAKQAS